MTSETPVSDKPDYASCSRRTAAACLDSLILLVPIFLLYDSGVNSRDYNILGQMAMMFYFGVFESSAWQASPGKKILGIRVETDKGARISFPRGLGRYAALCIPFLPFLIFSVSERYSAFMDAARELHRAHPEAPQSAVMTTPENRELMSTSLELIGVSVLLGVILIWLPMVFANRKSAMHDILTKTRVVK